MAAGVREPVNGVLWWDADRNDKSMVEQIPDFRSEDEERAFWATHDSTDYLDWSRAKPAVLSRLRPSTKTISRFAFHDYYAILKSNRHKNRCSIYVSGPKITPGCKMICMPSHCGSVFDGLASVCALLRAHSLDLLRRLWAFLSRSLDVKPIPRRAVSSRLAVSVNTALTHG